MTLFHAILPHPICYVSAEPQAVYETYIGGFATGLPSYRVIFARGNEMETLEGFYREVSAAWQFPYYFGYNSAAVVDCLSDLAWMPARRYHFVVLQADRLLCRENDSELQGFFKDILEVARRWREDMVALVPSEGEPISFDLLLQVGENQEKDFRRRIGRVKWADSIPKVGL
jgi:RNAse (barnase) inhibitor barstar